MQYRRRPILAILSLPRPFGPTKPRMTCSGSSTDHGPRCSRTRTRSPSRLEGHIRERERVRVRERNQHTPKLWHSGLPFARRSGGMSLEASVARRRIPRSSVGRSRNGDPPALGGSFDSLADSLAQDDMLWPPSSLRRWAAARGVAVLIVTACVRLGERNRHSESTEAESWLSGRLVSNHLCDGAMSLWWTRATAPREWRSRSSPRPPGGQSRRPDRPGSSISAASSNHGDPPPARRRWR